MDTGTDMMINHMLEMLAKAHEGKLVISDVQEKLKDRGWIRISHKENLISLLVSLGFKEERVMRKDGKFCIKTYITI